MVGGSDSRCRARWWAPFAAAAVLLTPALTSCTDSSADGTMSLLFVQTTASGTLEPVAGTGDHELVLAGVSPTTTWFSDRPQRRAGSQDTATVTAEWDAYGFAAEPPNAALVIDDLSETADTIVVELEDPRYDAAAGELRYRVRLLDEPNDGLADAQGQAPEQLPTTFGRASLFIDDAKATATVQAGSDLHGGTTSTATTTADPTAATTVPSSNSSLSAECTNQLSTFTSAATAGTYTSPALSIAFPDTVTLQNPAQPGATTSSQTVSIPFTAYDADGNEVSPSAGTPMTVSIHGAPPGAIQTTPAGTGESPIVVTVTDGTALSLTYSGAYLNRPVTVTATMPVAQENPCTGTPSVAIGSTSLALATAPAALGTVSYATPTVCSSGTSGTACATENVDSYGLRLSATIGYGAAVPGSSTAAASPTRFADYQIDTGSIGAVLPLDDLGPNAVGPGAPGLKYYDSSGNEFAGFVYLASVTLQMGSVQVTTDPIRVLAVVSSACHPNTKCTTPPSFSDFHYLGVGFDRATGTAADPFQSPRDNALLAITPTSGTMTPGYVLSGSTIQTGITSADSASSVVPLTASTTYPGDWNAMPGCIAFPTSSDPSPAPTCGSLLMDVGIPEMFVTFKSKADEPSAVSGGLGADQSISIVAPSQSSAALSYSFTNGATSGAAPSQVEMSVLDVSTPVFVNTGRYVLFVYQYVFNAQAGSVAFVPLDPALR